MSDNRSVSISIKATKDSGEADALYDAAWSLLAATVRKNAKHASAKEILEEYLDEAEDDGREFTSEKEIELSFRSPAGACDVQMEIAAHWFELAIALAAKELAAVCREHGYTMKPPRETARAIATSERKVPFVPNGDVIVGIKRGAKPKVLVDAQEALPIDEADLSVAARKLARTAATSGKCACAFCANVRAGKAAVAKLKTESKKKEAPAPAKPTELQHFTSLQKALRAPDRCGSLDLTGKIDMGVLPKDIGKLRRMTTLNVAENRLAKLPAALFTLTALESLNLSGNSFGELPAEIGNLVALKTLHLARTDITKLPDTLFDLPALEELTLSESCVKKIPPALLRLKRLRRLGLRHPHQLAAPLPNLGELGELESLDLARADNVARALDAIDFSSLKNLVELDLWWVDLPSFPASLRDLPRLQKLCIDQTGLSELPKTFATLSGLTELRAAKTKFTSWPAVLNDLPKLESVDFKFSRLANIDALRSLPALESLSLEGTRLTHLPTRAPDLRSLTTLVLNDAPITKLPDWLAELPSLKLLRVGRTELPKSEIAALKRKRDSLEVREF
jgi:Leucine-rich repeat (LRR) protein